MRTLPALLVLSGLACREPSSLPVAVDTSGPQDTADPSDTVPPAAGAPGVIRLGTPAPVTGLYGVAAHEASQTVFVSNLHAPWLTLVDAKSGEFSGAIDLRLVGIEVPWLPQLALVDEVLWLSDFTARRLVGFDPTTHNPIADVQLDAPLLDWFVTEDELWVLSEGGVDQIGVSGAGDRLPVPPAADRVALSETHLAWLDVDTSVVALYERGGSVQWSLTLEEDSLNDIAIIDERIYLTDRITGAVIALEGGKEVGRVITGSDTFGLTLDAGGLLVTNRQGRALPSSGAYQGDPGLITRLAADLSVEWQAEAGKTVHYLAWDGEKWWAPNEDSMDLTAIAPSGDVVLSTGKLGLTLDHVAQIGGDLFFGSHLTDEVWVLHDDMSAEVAEVCGWPWVTVPDSGGLWVPCQETGEVWLLDGETLDRIESHQLDTTFHPWCPDGLCSRHDLQIDAVLTDRGLAISDGQLPGVRWLDGGTTPLPMEAERNIPFQFFDLAVDGGDLFAYEPRSDTLHQIREATLLASHVPTPSTAREPLRAGGERLWVGAQTVDGAQLTDTLPDGAVVVAQSADWVVVREGWALSVRASDTLTEQGRLEMTELRVPPDTIVVDSMAPYTFLIDDTQLIVVSSFRGTVERRTLPELSPIGTDEVMAVGRWAALDGLW